MLHEVLKMVSKKHAPRSAVGTGMDYKPVSDLRKRLAEKGLDADGTKETLVKRLKTSHRGEAE